MMGPAQSGMIWCRSHYQPGANLAVTRMLLEAEIRHWCVFAVLSLPSAIEQQLAAKKNAAETDSNLT